MRQGPWHIFHFIGHGGFDADTNEGFIALVDKNGNTDSLDAQEHAQFFADHKSLGPVVPNCCKGARSGERDVISSTSSVVIRRGIPAVVAMQYALSDDTAIVFSGSFYGSLVDGYPIDASMAEARKAIRKPCRGTVEWGTPVPYLRSPGGELLDIERHDETPPAGVICKVCGAKNPITNQFCINCGKSLISKKPEPPPLPEYPKEFIYLGLLCPAGALCRVLLAMVSLGNTGASIPIVLSLGLSGLILPGSGISLLQRRQPISYPEFRVSDRYLFHL